MQRHWAWTLKLSALMALGLLVFWPGLYGGFVFDDYANLVQDPDWKLTALNIEQLRQAAMNGFAGAGGRPLAMLSFGLTYYFAGLDPFALKAGNLALHLVNGALLLVLSTRLFALLPSKEAPTQVGPFAAWIVTAVWMVHPLQVSTVLYVVQRMEMGAAAGILLALLAYLKARSLQLQGRRGLGWFGVSLLAMAFGLGFKETALLFPIYALLVEAVFLRFKAAGGKASRGLITIFAIGAATAVIAYAFWLVPHYANPDAYAVRDFTLEQRLLTQAPVLLGYLKQILLPLPQTFLFYYDNYPIASDWLSAPYAALSLAIHLGLLASAFLLRKKYPLSCFGLLWFYASHLLTSNIIPLELVFEHRNYLALFGIVMALCQPLAHAASRLHTDARRTMASLPVILVAVLCAIHAHTWGDPLRLASALASRNIDSSRAGFELGRTMLTLTGSDPRSPLWSFAYREFEHAARLPRSSPLAEQAIIIMDSRSGKPVQNAVWQGFQSKLAARPIGPEGVAALHGVLSCRQHGGCRSTDAQLLETFAVALKHNPDSAIVHSLYGTFAFNIIGDQELGIDVMREAVRLAPEDTQFKANLAHFLATAGRHSAELDVLLQDIRAANRNGRYTRELIVIERARSQPPR